MLGLFFIGLGIAGGIGYAIKSSYDANLAKELGRPTFWDGIEPIDPYTGLSARFTCMKNVDVLGLSKKCKYTDDDLRDMGCYIDKGQWILDFRPEDQILFTCDGKSDGRWNGSIGWVLRNYSAEKRLVARRLYKPIENELTRNAKKEAIEKGATIYFEQLDAEMYYDTKVDYEMLEWRGNLYRDLETGRTVVKRVIQQDFGYDEYYMESPLEEDVPGHPGEKRKVTKKFLKERGRIPYLVLQDARSKKLVRIEDETLKIINDKDKEWLEDLIYEFNEDEHLHRYGNNLWSKRCFYERIVKDDNGNYKLEPAFDLYKVDYEDKVILSSCMDKYQRRWYDKYKTDDIQEEKDILEFYDWTSSAGNLYSGILLMKGTYEKIENMNKELLKEIKGE